MLIFGLNETMDQLAMAKSVHRLCVEEGGWPCLEKGIRVRG